MNKSSLTVEERFWSKVDTSGGPEACWPWTAGLIKGYGAFKVHGRMHKAHRFVYSLCVGQLPEYDRENAVSAIIVRHLCHNTRCCNPLHLATGTHADNKQDCVDAGRQARGATHGWQTKPESRLFGDRSPSRRYPGLTRGEKNGRAKVTEAQVQAIRLERDRNNTGFRELGKMFGISKSQAFAICKQTSWAPQ
jgi:hypothetical protein